MFTNLLTIFSHLLFIYWSYLLLTSVVDWPKILIGTAENSRKIQVLILFLSIALGLLVSNFFLQIVTISRSLAQAVLQ